jgi:hypothetical protein
MLAAADTSSMSSPPQVVAATIVKSLLATRPKTRYATGGGARFILMLRKLLSDHGFDALLRTISNRAAR